MTVTDQRDLALPGHHVEVLRKRLDAEQAVADQITALTAEPGWSASRFDEFDRLRGEQDSHARSLVLLVRVLLEEDDTEGRPA